MFESIVYKNAPGPGPLIDIGALAEGLIFYGRVVVVGNTATLKGLLARVPPFVLLSLMRGLCEKGESRFATFGIRPEYQQRR
jgi:hypothetical protein